ncbi:MAG: nucleotidyltransferase family protein [Planctomycetaceae bacterium]|nr:nucleotidyltransferase family protein [Planctomycetaceae bacterium]
MGVESNSSPRVLYAVVPAAGLSRRMGQPKLLLPLGGKTVMARLLEALHQPQIACRAVVLRREDEDLCREVQKAQAWRIQPQVNPREMRESVEIALTEIGQRFSPNPQDGWLLVPADHPTLSPRVINNLVSAWQTTSADILIPSWEGRRGHPTIFSWELATRVCEIPPNQGLNWLVRCGEFSLEELPLDDPAIFTDLDTPDDYEALKRTFAENS